MTFRELLQDQAADVEQLLDTEIGQPTGNGAASITASIEQHGAEVRITLPPAWAKDRG